MARHHYSRSRKSKTFIAVQCAGCQSCLLVPPYRVKRSKNFFCKPECHTAYFQEKIGDTKICSACHKGLPLDAFGIARSKLSGRRGQCKECCNQKRMDAYYADPETHRARHREDRKKHGDKRRKQEKNYVEKNKESIRIKKKAYNVQNREKNAKASRARRAKNPQKIRQREAAYRKKNPEIYKIVNARRRARKKNAPIVDLTRTQWEFLKKLYNYRCVYCGEKPKLLTKDHITPLAAGGSHTMSNIVPACKMCNSKKGKGAPLVPVQPALGLAI